MATKAFTIQKKMTITHQMILNGTFETVIFDTVLKVEAYYVFRPINYLLQFHKQLDISLLKSKF